MPFKYHSGEEIWKDDRVVFGGEPGHVEFVADSLVKHSETDWYVQEYGGG